MKKLLVLVLLVTGLVGAQEKVNMITGKMTYLDTPLVQAEVKSLGAGESVKTDSEGRYRISVSPGDILEYRYPGLRTLEIVVEDVSRILNVELLPEVNQLDEVVVKKTVIKTQKEMQAQYATNKSIINSAFGFIDKETTNFAMRIVDGKDLNPIGIDIATALQLRVPGIQVHRPLDYPLTPIVIYLRGGTVGMFPAVYDVDGLVMRDFPDFLQIENIERIAVISGLGAVTKYGGFGNGGVIVINTKGANFYGNDAQGPNDLARLRGNLYDGNAIGTTDLKADLPSYMIELMASKSLDAAKAVYHKFKVPFKTSTYFGLDAYEYFSTKQNDLDFADAIIQENKEVLSNNPVALKGLAYLYQADGRYLEANELYKEIFILRPNYVQSYLDMANSYREIGEYQKAAGIYARYGYLLEQGFLRKAEEASMLMERDLNNLVTLKGRELLDRRDLKKLVLDDEFKGTRLVFEWNDSEAEFELQFVNPEGNYFKSEHSLFADAERIKKEKIAGISSEEYLIDESLRGIWQVNVKYLGNKQLGPTYLKATVYHDFGSAAQRKETKVFKLAMRNLNQKLFTVSNAATMASN